MSKGRAARVVDSQPSAPSSTSRQFDESTGRVMEIMARLRASKSPEERKLIFDELLAEAMDTPELDKREKTNG